MCTLNIVIEIVKSLDTVSVCKTLFFFLTSYSLEIMDAGDRDGNGIGTYRVHCYQDFHMLP